MYTGKQFEESVMRDEIVVCDWDGVIQSIDVLWLKNMLEQEELFGKYFDLSKLKNENDEYDLTKVLDRDTYYIDKFLLKDGMELPERVSKKWIDCYMKDEEFYNNCPFLVMASSLRNLLVNRIIKEVHFVSHAPLGIETDTRKQPLMEKFFGKVGNVRIDCIHGNMKKSEFINKNIPNYTAFIDDRSDIIRDVIDNTNSSNKTFIMPIYTYNKEILNDTEYLSNLNSKGIRLSAYINDLA